MPELEFADETEVLLHLVQEYDVEEIILSILTAGWLDYEPLIATRDNTVIEGNRRLAALRLIQEEGLRQSIGYTVPNVPDEHPNARPDTVSVRYSDSREDAYVYIGFKHINGPFKWDALAKAKFAADWVDKGADIDVVSRTLGDSHNTVLRLVNGWNVLNRARDEGFLPENSATTGAFPISHLYTALTRPTVRQYLGIDKPARTVLARDDIDQDHVPNLMQLMSWLYGDRTAKLPSLIRTQNPDLGALVRVMAHDGAFQELLANRDLDKAETELTSSNERFDIAVRRAARACEEALVSVDDYDGSKALLDVVNNMGSTILTLRERMSQRRPDPLAAFADATPKT
jgi:hypothetical protein